MKMNYSTPTIEAKEIKGNVILAGSDIHDCVSTAPQYGKRNKDSIWEDEE